MHKVCCFAGDSAPEGYFTNNTLPCVCSKENLFLALSEVAMPMIPLGMTALPAVHLLPLSA